MIINNKNIYSFSYKKKKGGMSNERYWKKKTFLAIWLFSQYFFILKKFIWSNWLLNKKSFKVSNLLSTKNKKNILCENIDKTLFYFIFLPMPTDWLSALIPVFPFFFWVYILKKIIKKVLVLRWEIVIFLCEE